MATLEVKLEHVGSIREAQQATLKFKSEQGLKIRVAENFMLNIWVEVCT
jgi:hypothetical protein